MKVKMELKPILLAAHTITSMALTGLALAATTLFCACSGDDLDNNDNTDNTVGRELLQVVPIFRTFDDVTGDSEARASGPATRAVTVPSGFVDYSILYPLPDESYRTIGVFMTPHNASMMNTIVYQNDPNDPTANPWRSNIYVEQENQYYMYGFMPSETASSASITPLDNDYAKGAVLSLQGLDVITPADLCVIVGVEDILLSGLDANNVPTSNGEVKLGVFSYDGTDRSVENNPQPKAQGQHWVRLLLDHIYSAIHFKMQMTNGNYSQLRDIHLRKMEIVTSTNKSVNVTITLTARPQNDTDYEGPLSGATAVQYSLGSTVESPKVTLFEGDRRIPTAAEVAADPTKEFNIAGYFTPTIDGIGDSFSIICTFDVYDKEGNLVRQLATATNTLPSIKNLLEGRRPLARGEKNVVAITVNPTYLYQLSDPDLDNPSISF